MIRVLVADDSPLFADAIVDVLVRDREIDVVGVACDGAEAVRLTEQLHPDIVVMDVRMPVMDGLAAIEEIMRRAPTPVLVMTSDPRGDSGELSFEALRRGALDLVVKPSAWPVSAGEQEAMRQHLKLLAGVAVVQRAGRRRSENVSRGVEPVVLAAGASFQAVGIVASTGGPAALAMVLGGLGRAFPLPVLVVQHLAPGFAPRLATWLDAASQLHVRLARQGDTLEPGVVLLAPDDTHMEVDRAATRVYLDASAPVGGHRPSGTVLLRSLGQACGATAIGVVLTGMGGDGAKGLLTIREAGGLAMVQDEASSVVYGMPRAARELGAASMVVPLQDVAGELERAARRKGSA